MGAVDASGEREKPRQDRNPPSFAAQNFRRQRVLVDARPIQDLECVCILERHIVLPAATPSPSRAALRLDDIPEFGIAYNRERQNTTV